VNRREFLGPVVLGLLATARPAGAQSTGKLYRVGVLSSGRSASPPLEAFGQGLRDLGWIQGQNILVDYRVTDGRADRLDDLAAELVRLGVDVIAAGPTPPALAAKKATGTIPIVMLGAASPVELGLVDSLARPGRNVTGMSWSDGLEIIGKGLELLKETLPKLRLAAVLWNPTNPAQQLGVHLLKEMSRSAGVQLQLLEARGPDELAGAFAAMTKQRVEAVLVVADALFVSHGARLAEFEARYRLPSMHSLRANVEAGGLMSYGPDLVTVWRRAAVFVDRILKGAKPADLPVEQPTTYELVINLKTAKALGLTIPPAVLARADEVIR
jgi:putative ABC transport system substrate-binding protein